MAAMMTAFFMALDARVASVYRASVCVDTMRKVVKKKKGG
jgi:hypothetical protein